MFPAADPLNGFGVYFIYVIGGITLGPFSYKNAKAVVLSGGNLELTNETNHPADASPSTWAISRGWGVNGDENTLDLLGKSYSNAITNRVVVEDWDNGGRSSSAFVIWQLPNADVSNLIVIDNGSSYTVYFQWYNWEGTNGSYQNVVLPSVTYGTGLEAEYEIKLWDGAYDGFKSFVSADKYSFEWQLNIDGSTVYESITGSTRNYSRLSVGGMNMSFCSDPSMIMQASMNTTAEISEWDITINGNTSCL